MSATRWPCITRNPETSARAAQFESRFAESPKSDVDATARAAALYLNAGDTQKALSLARKSALQQHSAANEDLLGRALIASGQLTEGTLHFQDAARLAPADPQVAFDYGQALLRKEEFGAAADALSSALQAHPDDAQLVLAMGVARYGQRRFEECITLFLQVIKLDPNIEQPYTFLGQILDQAGSHLVEITDAYKAWVARKPRDANASFLLGKALVSGGNDREAEALIRRSISIDNRRWDSHYELGVLEMKKHRYQQALAELIRSRDLAPEQPPLITNSLGFMTALANRNRRKQNVPYTRSFPAQASSPIGPDGGPCITGSVQPSRCFSLRIALRTLILVACSSACAASA